MKINEKAMKINERSMKINEKAMKINEKAMKIDAKAMKIDGKASDHPTPSPLFLCSITAYTRVYSLRTIRDLFGQTVVWSFGYKYLFTAMKSMKNQ